MRRVATGFLALLLLATPVDAFRTTLTHTAVSVLVTPTSTAALAANGSRNFLKLQNDHGTQVIYCKFGAAAVVNEGIRVNAAGGEVTFDTGVPTGALNCTSTGGTSVLLVSEGAGN